MPEAQMVSVGLLLSDVPVASVSAAEQFADVLAIVEAGQELGFDHFTIGQHFLYGEQRWLQPVPLMARLAAEVDPHVRLVTNIIVAPLYHPVLLAEEIATLDVVTEGRLVFGAGLGYRAEEFDHLDVPFRQRASRFDESLELMRRLWTEDEVTHHGRHWRLDGVRPHLRPVQDPHPPIWIGAQALPGVRRCGRFGDGYATPPEATRADIAERFAVVRDGFAERGKAFRPQPLRRNVTLGASRDEAVAEYARVAQGKYLTYARKGFEVMSGEDLERDFAATVADHAVLGTPEQVTAELLGYVRDLPVDPLLVRLGWPPMSRRENLDAMRLFGREVLPALRAQPARRDLADPA
ncbi:LLM class flavin-dependent oxidoreductase [Nocardioides nitrophenolicus]|uniref:LLM class flavin-dependent oxidoreductase n=1 Tax=Nocardioides nitrophenolicus TaxID=60489 RepID=UPI001959C999|nr:LLM class flavin-dependent oxidoreductase [Nocardioides nitrophenolicus]MBM7516447.1 alkanesulfonate monooxygenase SsuD/methylene tetrahydromethanopterin reductase-like flavin-dependent oxidoreductase (luciferase family) [Nocardioides nitrophenolicus]